MSMMNRLYILLAVYKINKSDINNKKNNKKKKKITAGCIVAKQCKCTNYVCLHTNYTQCHVTLKLSLAKVYRPWANVLQRPISLIDSIPVHQAATCRILREYLLSAQNDITHWLDNASDV